MDARGTTGILQSLFARPGPDGHCWEFAALANGGCAVLRDGGVLMRGDGSEETVAYLLREFLRSSGARPAAWCGAGLESDDAGASPHAA